VRAGDDGRDIDEAIAIGWLPGCWLISSRMIFARVASKNWRALPTLQLLPLKIAIRPIFSMKYFGAVDVIGPPPAVFQLVTTAIARQ
jgi:hypothetical protein